MQYPKLIESKTSDNEVKIIEWNPGMDLLATVFNNGSLTCSRLLSLQKVWNKQSHGRIISITWRPDGRVLAICSFNYKTKEYLCTLHDVENGKKIHTITKESSITSVAWFEEKYNDDDTSRHRKSNPPSASETFSHQLAHDQTQLSILVISTDDLKVSFYALGLFHLGSIAMDSGMLCQISTTHMSCCLRYISIVIHNSHSMSSFVRILKLDTFKKRSNEILRVSKMYAKITDELEYLDDTINAITTSWADVLAGLDSKLSSYCSRKSKKANESRSGYTFLSADELLQLLVVGDPSDNLEKFLTDMSDKGLKKLDNAIKQTCLRVQNLIVKNAQKCCYHLHADLNLLRGMSLWRERYEEVGLNDRFIVESMQSVGSLMLKLTEFQQVIDHSLKSTKSFFRWLVSIACRMTGEQNNSSVPNDINKTTQQDIQLINDFILENFDYNSNHEDLDNFSSFIDQTDDVNNESGVFSNRPTCSNFTLEQVGQYLKDEPLSRQKYSFAKPNSNFWIEFFKQRPDLTEMKTLDEDGSTVLLFYPHNSDTSLIQEHKKTRKSIEAVFKSVANNMRLGYTKYDFLTQFTIRNGLTDRIRIETDLKLMQHYVIFQTKQGPVAKQYLISHSLDDQTFKLLSIEFTPSMGPSSSKQSRTGNLLISDSNFYENKESKKLLLTFLLLDKTSGDTIILQVELERLFESSPCVDRPAKDLTKAFKNNDSIDKYCDQIILKLDLYTEPASDRQHGKGMVVKKVKNIAGRDMFCSSSRGVIAFTSCGNKRIHLYELESMLDGVEIMDDEVESDEKIDESLIDTELVS